MYAAPEGQFDSALVLLQQLSSTLQAATSKLKRQSFIFYSPRRSVAQKSGVCAATVCVFAATEHLDIDIVMKCGSMKWCWRSGQEINKKAANKFPSCYSNAAKQD